MMNKKWIVSIAVLLMLPVLACSVSFNLGQETPARETPVLPPPVPPVAVPPTPPPLTIVPTEPDLPPPAPTVAALTPDEIMSRSAAMTSEVTSAHIIFQQEVPGSYTRTGWGDVVLPDRARFHASSNGEEPAEMIVIGATGYWRDEAVSAGWNGGPIAPFQSNPANWVALSQYYANPIALADETINGIDCYHSQFTVNLEPGWLGLFSGGGTGDAWIAKTDYSLVKAIYDLQYQGTRESGSMNLTFELSQFNMPVSIVAPM